MATKADTPEMALAKAIAAAQTAVNRVIADSAVPDAVTKANVAEFTNLVNGLIADLQKAKAPHQKLIRTQASQASRAKKAERVKQALALLEQQEAAGGKGATVATADGVVIAEQRHVEL